MYNPYHTNFDTSDAYLDKLFLFSDAHIEKFEIRNVMTVKIPKYM
jgi:hypothetical protein